MELKKNVKKYYVDCVSYKINTYQLVCEHPNNDNYYIYLDEFERPQRITKAYYNKLLLFTDYEEAKDKLMKEHEEAVKYWKESFEVN